MKSINCYFRYIISQFTLNSLDLGSSRPNTFSFHAPVLDLFEYCGLQEAKVSLQGLNMDTFRWDKLPAGVYIIQIIDIPPFFKNHIFSLSTVNISSFPHFYTSYPYILGFSLINHHILSPTNQLFLFLGKMKNIYP